MPSGLDLLVQDKPKSGLDLFTPNALGSNIPPFDIALPKGADPNVVAQNIIDSGGKRSGLELLKPSQPKSTLPVETSTDMKPFDIEEMFGKLLPGVAEEAAKPKIKPELPFGGVTSLSRSDDKPNFIERSLNAISNLFGGENVGKLSEGAKAQALVMHMAKEEGVPVDQYRQSPEFIEKLASSFISMSTFGLAPTIKKGLTGEVEYPAVSTAGYVGGALGSLAGLYTSPMWLAGKLVRPTLNFLPQAFQGEAVTARLLKSALRDSILLAPALGLSELGASLEQTTFPQAADKIWEGVKGGASIGAIFGVSRGLFPKEGVQTGARIFTGLVGLNAYRAKEVGGNPFTNRPVGDVLFDIALDSAFLYKGLPKDMRVEIAQDLKDLNDRIDKSKIPPPAPEGSENIPPEVLQQAQEKVAAVEKVQIDLEAKRVAEKAKAAIEAKAELEVKGEEIKKIKGGEKVAEPKVTFKEFVESKDIEWPITQSDPKYKSLLEGYEGLGKEKTEAEEDAEIKKLLEEGEEIDPALRAAMEEPVKTGVDLIKPKKVKKAKAKVKPEPITPLDESTGSPHPAALAQDVHPFRDTDAKRTNGMSLLYKEKIQKVADSPEVFTRFLINETNRWLNGEDVPIDKIRNGLSELSTKASELDTKFDRTVDWEAWRDTVGEAAKWARGADRLIDKRTGTKLTMGLDPTQISEATKKIIEGARKVSDYYLKARGMKEFKPAEAAERTKEELTRSFVDRSGNIRRELLDQLGDVGYGIVQRMYLERGSSSLSALNLKQMGKEVYDGLSKSERGVLDQIILDDRMLDIAKYKTVKEFKFPDGRTPADFAGHRDLFQYKNINKLSELSSERAELLNQRAKAYFNWMKKPLKDMLDAELIPQGEYDALVSHNYRRIKLVEIFDKSYQTKIGKRIRTVYDSGVETLAHGRDTDVYEPSSEVMALEVFNRAYGRIFNNAANKTLLDLARTQPDNPFVAVKEKPTDRIPTGWNRIFVYEKGERKAIYLSPEMGKEWITNNPEMSYKLSQFLRYASGSPVLRTFATGIDWGFALANLPRDVMHTWFTARVFRNGKWESVYSPNLPMFGLQMLDDQIAVFSDALLRKGRYEDYIREGGGMEFLVHQGRLLQRGRHIEGGIDKVQDFLGYFGETTEIMTRLAIRERVIRNRANEQGISFEEASRDPKVRQEATFAARDYMDFGQGGGITKALDNGIPYLNAAVIGTRGMIRSFKPGSGTAMISTYKLAQLAVLVSGLYIANRKLNPETMAALQGNIDMQNNLVIPLGDGFSFLDEKGQTRYPYLKIPIDPGQKFFKTFFEASTDKWLGNPVDVNAVTNSLTQLSPVGISSLPPTLGAVLGYVTNKDFWLNEDIWKKTDKPLSWPQSKEEYIPGRTPQAAIDFGALTGMSPERTKVAVEQLITGGSMWSWLVGQGYEKLLGDLPKDKKEMHLAEVLSKIPVIKRFVGITNPYSQFAQPVEVAREMSTLERWIQNRGLDTVVESYLYKEGTSRKEVVDYISSFKDKDVYDRLKDRFVFQEKIKDLPNRSFWLALKGTPDTGARARLYVQRLDRASDEERQQLMREVGTVTGAGGVISDEFRKEVMRLRGGE